MSSLPTGWTQAQVGDLVILNPKNDAHDCTLVGFVPMSRLGVDYRSPVSYEPRRWSDIKKGYTHFADGDVLLAKITPCFENGKAGLASNLPNGLGAGSTEYFVSRPRDGVLHARYLLGFLKTETFLRDGALQMTGSVGHKRVPKEYLLETEIPLAPLNEQKRIADKLDAVLARVEACCDRLDRIPAILKRFRQSVLAAATSGDLTQEWRVDQGIVPDSWTEFRLEEVCTKITDGEHISPALTSSGVPLVSAKDVRESGVDFSDTKFVSSDFSSVSRRRCNPELDDVLVVSRGATVGRTCLITSDREFCLMGSVLLFKPTVDVVNPRYLAAFLRSPLGFERLTGASGASAQSAIYIRDTKNLLISLPPKAEQTEIVRRVESLFAYADRLEARYAAARAQVERLTPATLAKAFRGELVPQDPSDEPASALLARIRAQRGEQTAGRPRCGQKGLMISETPL